MRLSDRRRALIGAQQGGLIPIFSVTNWQSNTGFNTGFVPFDTPKDFSILASFVADDRSGELPTVFACVNNDNPWNGFCVQFGRGAWEYKVYAYPTDTPISKPWGENIKVCFRYQNGICNLLKYKYNGTVYNPPTGASYYEYTNQYLWLGCHSNYNFIWDGLINSFALYDVALSDAEVNSFFAN